MAVLGLDFGGTKLAAGLVDGDGTVLARQQCPTPHDAETSIAAMLCMVADLRRDARQISAVGVSFGGVVAPDGRQVQFSMHIPGWEALPLAERLEQHLGVPIAVANDADACAVAEHCFGAGRGVQDMLYVTVSTGIGGGVISDGRLYRGARGWSGQVGHMVLQPDGPLCPCGRNGCLEALASGLSVARAMGEAIKRAARPLPSMPISAEQVAAWAAAGDPLAAQVWDDAMGWLGVGVASAANLLNPACVVIGGGMTNAGEQLFGPVRVIAARRALDPDLLIVPAALGANVGILGGAALVL